MGYTSQSHRFRYLPDLQYTTTTDNTMQNLREHIVPGVVNAIKGFSLPPEQSLGPGQYLGPPPAFANDNPSLATSYPYRYVQNNYVKFTTSNTGEVVASNLSKARTYRITSITFEEVKVPSTRPPWLLAEKDLEAGWQHAIKELRALLDERPIATKRMIRNTFHGKNIRDYHMKAAFAYCGYVFTKGPWRDAIVKYGVDPRTDPKYRKYQILMFKLNETGATWLNHKSYWKRTAKHVQPGVLGTDDHTFNGKSIGVIEGKQWQLCDISDPLISRVLDTPNLRTVCDLNHGWYLNGTCGKASVIMKDKLMRINDPNKEPLPDSFYEFILTLPEDVTEETRLEYYQGRGYKEMQDPHMGSLCNAIRTYALQEMRFDNRAQPIVRQIREGTTRGTEPPQPYDEAQESGMMADALGGMDDEDREESEDEDLEAENDIDMDRT